MLVFESLLRLAGEAEALSDIGDRTIVWNFYFVHNIRILQVLILVGALALYSTLGPQECLALFQAHQPDFVVKKQLSLEPICAAHVARARVKQ